MKMNWGYGIMIFYICFASTLIFVLIQSFNVKHNLVVDNYYDDDLSYQTTIDKRNNYLRSNNIIIKTKKKEDQIEFNFIRTKSLSGNIHFYRPSNKDEDFVIPILESTFTFDTKDISNGKWKVKIDWQDDNVFYYHEKDIYL
jgi:hypothetical protein